MDNEIMNYDSAKNIIRRDLESMSRKFITIGYYLKLIRDNEMYRQDGFRDIWEFAQDTYGISKSTCSRWMAMNDKFSQDGNSPYLKEEYRDFGKSQLQEMLYLTDEQMEQARPDMTAKEIREIRKPEAPKIELKKPDDRGCITGKNPNGNCVCCGKGGVECCTQCKEKCNGECGWIDAAIVQQDPEEQIQGQMEIQDYPEVLPKEKTGKCLHREEMLCTLSEKGKRTPGTGEDCYEKCCWECPKHGDCNLECIASSDREQQEPVAPSQQEEDQEDYMNPPEDLDTEEIAEIIEAVAYADPEEKYEELSDKTDMELLRDLLDGAQNMLKTMNEAYTENDIRVRKQKLMIGAYAGMIADLDQDDISEDTQPELPFFKNNDQRKEWLRNYQAWGLWYEDKNIGARYYKYDFDNGARLIAEEYTRSATEWYEEHTISYLHLVGGPEPPKDKSGCVPKWNRHEIYDKYPNSETELVEFLKYIQKER